MVVDDHRFPVAMLAPTATSDASVIREILAPEMGKARLAACARDDFAAWKATSAVVLHCTGFLVPFPGVKSESSGCKIPPALGMKER